MKEFHLSLLWDCNQRCAFCAKGPPPEGAKRRLSLREAAAIVKRMKRTGCDSITFDGGEPTLLPDLPRIIRSAVEAGYKNITVMTNGVLLSDPARVRLLMDAHDRVKEKVCFCVALHSHREAVSERLTGARGTFHKTIRGIENLAKAGVVIHLYHVITSLNYKDLRKFAFFVARMPGIKEVVFSYIFPTLHNIRRQMDLYPRVSEVRPYFKKALAALEKSGIETSMSNCGNVPLCLMRGNEELYIQSYRDNLDAISCDSSKTEAVPFFLESFDRITKVKAAGCRACRMDPVCGGISKFYAIIHGLEELAPYDSAPESLSRLRKPAVLFSPRPEAARHR